MSLLDDFDSQVATYERFATKVHVLLEELLAAAGARVHSVATRVKERASFGKKIARVPDKYKKLVDMTDLCGARIITYFEDDVETVAALVEREFNVDTENSVDKRQTMDVDRFGYVSVHYVVELNAVRSTLSEYMSFRALKVEIQVRSILQHTWAEIEHDLGYKSVEGIPRQIRRRFARLAGLLEVADAEFTGIRDAIRSYRQHVEQTLPSSADLILTDKDSLQVMATTIPIISALDQRIAALFPATLLPSILITDPVVKLLSRFGLTTIELVEQSISQDAAQVIQFAGVWLSVGRLLSEIRSNLVSRGICLYYFCLLHLARTQSSSKIEEALTAVRYKTPFSNAEMATRILKAYEVVERH